MPKHLIAAIALFAASAPAFAEGLQLPAIDHEATAKECSACHMAFQPQFLPARSWTALLGGLADHFGENAQLDPAVAEDIRAYLVANAGDSPTSRKSRWLRGVGPDVTPLRITELPMWIRAHRGEVSAAAFDKAGSKANCKACHAGADKGYYGDD